MSSSALDVLAIAAHRDDIDRLFGAARVEAVLAVLEPGMSLAVASLLALRMGGELKLDSQEGQGTSAELCLPKA